MVSSKAKRVINSIKPKVSKVPQGQTQKGSAGYDNIRDDIEKTKALRELSLPFTKGSVLFMGDNAQITQDNANLFWNVGMKQLEPYLIRITNAGSAAYPALKLNDRDTGIYSGGSNIISFSTAGTHRMTIDATGQIGIKTTSPAGTFDVQDGTGTQTAGDFTIDAPNHIIYVGQLDTIVSNTTLKFRDRLGNIKSRWNNASSGSIYFGLFGGSNFGVAIIEGHADLNAVTKGLLEVNSTGRADGITATFMGGDVGIGVTDPHSKLEVAGAISSATLNVTANQTNLDVSGVNTIFINITGDITLSGLQGGVNGQTLNIVIVGNFVNHVTLGHAAGTGTQDFINHLSVDELMDHGGAIYVCNGTDWYDASHSRHV